MTELESFLAVLDGFLAVILLILVFVVSYFRRKSRLYYNNWQTRQTGAYNIGAHQAIGDMSQVLGTFSFLGNYDQIILLSTTSSQASLDLLGVKNDCLEFVELKKKGTLLQKSERKIKQLVDQGKVKYVIRDVEWPGIVRITERVKT
jgi:hypothetical protein